MDFWVSEQESARGLGALMELSDRGWICRVERKLFTSGTRVGNGSIQLRFSVQSWSCVHFGDGEGVYVSAATLMLNFQQGRMHVAILNSLMSYGVEVSCSPRVSTSVDHGTHTPQMTMQPWYGYE